MRTMLPVLAAGALAAGGALAQQLHGAQEEDLYDLAAAF
jgi:hypothetical protein